jgi:hypothetical protein
VLQIQDPGSDAFDTPGSGIQNPGWVKIRIRIPDEQPDHISESLEPTFWIKILKILGCGFGIRDGKNSDPGLKKFGSGMEKI